MNLNIYNWLIKVLLIELLIILSVLGYPSNRWQHISSEHFTLSYNKKTAHLSTKALEIAEETARSLADFFGYDIIRRKISIALYDDNDFSNGSASILSPLVKIYCRKTNWLWRGETNWLRTVLSHELSHIYSIRAIKSPIIITAGAQVNSDSLDFQGSAQTYYEHRMLPIWFVEGVAQLGSLAFGADYRDPFREMLLKDAYMHNRLLSLNEMSHFEGTSREAELAYNQGFDLVLYMIQNYEDVSMNILCEQIRAKGFKIAIKQLYKRSIKEIYKEWVYSLKDKYSLQKRKSNSAPLFKAKNRPLNIEISTVNNGRYTITNWDHDYSRFDLFKVSKNKPKKIAHDVGYILRKDDSDNSVWFTKDVYNHKSGTNTYDLYKLNHKGKEKRITKNSRCMAFDVKKSNIIYASYKDGKTSLVSKKLNGATEVLYTFTFDTAVYNISMISPNSAILSLGTGTGHKIAFLENKKLSFLWEDIPVEVMDGVAIGMDMLIFISTQDGTPQLYWCAWKNNPDEWYQITQTNCGVRFPSIDQSEDDIKVYVSVFENGGFTLHSIKDPFPIDKPVLIRKANMEDDRPEWSSDSLVFFDQVKHHAGNIVISPPIISLGYKYDKELVSEQYNVSNQGFIGCYLQIENAPGNVVIGISGDIGIPFGKTHVPKFSPSWSTWIDKNIGRSRLSLFYGAEHYWDESIYDTSYYDTSNTSILEINNPYKIQRRSTRNIECSLDFQLSKWQNLILNYRYLWQTSESNYSYPYTEVGTNFENIYEYNENYHFVFESHMPGINWRFYYLLSKFDPANLGTPLIAINIGGNVISSKYPSEEYYLNLDHQTYSIDPTIFYETHFRILASTLLLNKKLSLIGSIDGFFYLNGIKNNKISLYSYNYIGNENLFSGYPQIYLKTVYMARLIAELRFNPFVNTANGISCFERSHIGVKVETGGISFFTNSLQMDIPLSLECAVRHSFYLFQSRLSNFYCKIALPLRDFYPKEKFPDAIPLDNYRIYFGIQL